MGERYDRRQVQRLRFAVESSFGTDMTDDVAGNFNDLRHMPTFIKRDTMTEPDNTVRHAFFQQRNVVLGPERGSVSVEAYFTGSNDPAGDADGSTKTPQSTLIEALMGGFVSANGDAVAASPLPTTTTFEVTGDIGRFVEGQVVSVAIGGVDYPAVVQDITGDALTVWPALPSAPSASAVIYNSQTCYLDETDEKSLQWLHETQIDRGNIWGLKGCQGSLDFNLSRGGLLTFTTAQQGAMSVHDDELTTPQGGSALSRGTFVGTGPRWGTEGGFHFGPSASSTRNLVRCQEFSLSLGISWGEAGDYAGLEGIGEWERAIPEITAELTILKNASDGSYEAYRDAFRAETDYGFLWWVGASAGSGVCIAAPTCQIMAEPEPVEVNGMEAQKLSLLIKESTLTGAVANALQVSPVVVAQF